MVDFSSLLKKPAGEAKKPRALPAADYPGIIKSFEYGDNNQNQPPYVRFGLGVTGPAPSVDSAEFTDIDLSKRQLRRDFYLTDDAFWRLDEFLRNIGLDPKGRSYEEVIPEAVGTPVTLEVQQYLNQTSNEIGNQVGKVGAAQ